MIYFIACPAANAVKIGITAQGWRATPLSAAFARLGQAQVNCPLPLELRAVCQGGREEEAMLHQRFADIRIRGEWFTVSGGLKALIDAMPKPPTLGRGWHFARNHGARDGLPPLPVISNTRSPVIPVKARGTSGRPTGPTSAHSTAAT